MPTCSPGSTARGRRLGALLEETGLLDERSLAWALAQQHGLALVDLSREAPEPDALDAIPETLARALGVVPLRLGPGTILVALEDPSHPSWRQEIERAAGARAEAVVAPRSEVRRTIDASYRAIVDIERHIEAFRAVDVTRGAVDDARESFAEDAPVVHVVNMIVTQALRDRASDVHIEPQNESVRVRFRIDGALHDVTSIPSRMGPAVVSRIKILASMNIVERQRPLDGQFTTEVDDRSIDVRVSTTPTIWGEKAVLRILDKSRTLYRLSDLGMPADTSDRYSSVIRSPFGMVLCAGPTGSGKTTTLYATMTEINASERNVMTIEDPVEYVFPSINQIQIKEQAGLSFASGLRSILRQDPDVILVGEIRDVETARIAVQSALTGHFVLSSLHATDAASALQRFIDMGIESFLVASSVIAVVGQRLVRRICEHCREPFSPTGEERVFYEDAGGPPKSEFWHGAGCNFCAQTGFQDRIGVYELLHVTEEIKALLMRGGSHSELRALAVHQGMRPLREEALQLVADDVTTIGEVVRAIYVL